MCSCPDCQLEIFNGLISVENPLRLRLEREPPDEMEENGVLVGVLGKHWSGKESCSPEVLQRFWWAFSLFLKFEGVIILWLNVRASCVSFWECCSYYLFDGLSMGNLWLSRCFAAGTLLGVCLCNSIVLSSQNVVPSLHQLQWFYSSSCVLRLCYFSSSLQLCLGPKYTPSALMKRWVSHTLSFTLSLTISRNSDGLQGFASWHRESHVPSEERSSVIELT